MIKTTNKHRSTILWRASSWMVGRIVGLCAVGPALYYNLDWMSSNALYDNLSSAAMVAISALIVEACRHARAWWQVAVGFVVAIALIWSNALNAFETLSNAADHRADDRKAVISDVDRQSSTRNQWSTIVDEARKVVGDRPLAEYESDLQQYLSANAGKWRATQECNPLEITRSKDFCAEVARMQKLVSVAQQRDEHRAKIEALDTKLGLITKPTHADPFVSNVAAFLGVFGVKPLPESLEAIRSMKSLSRALALEAMATFGPMMIFALFDGLALASAAVAGRVPAPAARAPAYIENAPAAKRKKPEPQAPAEPKAKATDEFHRFCADCLEEGPTFSLDPTPAFKQWKEWCGRRGLQHGSQKRFGGMMGERFKRDANNGYPRYLGVRAKPAVLALRVVSSH